MAAEPRCHSLTAAIFRSPTTSRSLAIRTSRRPPVPRRPCPGWSPTGASPGTLNMNGAGTLVLSANNPIPVRTNVNAGTLDVTGSIASSILTSVAAVRPYRHRHDRQSANQFRRYVCARRRDAGHVNGGRRQSRIPVGRDVSGFRQSSHGVVYQRERQSRCPTLAAVGVRAWQRRLPTIWEGSSLRLSIRAAFGAGARRAFRRRPARR